MPTNSLTAHCHRETIGKSRVWWTIFVAGPYADRPWSGRAVAGGPSCRKAARSALAILDRDGPAIDNRTMLEGWTR